MYYYLESNELERVKHNNNCLIELSSRTVCSYNKWNSCIFLQNNNYLIAQCGLKY